MGLFKSIAKIAPIAGAAIGGIFGGPAGASIGGSIGGMISGSQGAADQNAANSAQAQRQMDFQERMSNTSWQRGMADMRAAGLNPIFAYKAGGASTPQGAQATMVNENAAGIEGLSKVSNSAVALAQNKAQLYNLQQQGRLTNMNVAESSSRVGLNQTQEDQTRAQVKVTNAQAARVAAEASSAQAVAKMNHIKSKIVERDIKYKLANPSLMKGEVWNRFINQILGNIPVFGATVSDQQRPSSNFQIRSR